MPTLPALPAKHEAFALLCAGGLAAGAAYARIHPKASAATAETEGPALLRKPQVKGRVVALQAKVEREFTMTRIEWLESLVLIAKKAEAAQNYAAARGCLREIGLAMPGWYSPEKQEHDGKLEIVITKIGVPCSCPYGFPSPKSVHRGASRNRRTRRNRNAVSTAREWRRLRVLRDGRAIPQSWLWRVQPFATSLRRARSVFSSKPCLSS